MSMEVTAPHRHRGTSPAAVALLATALLAGCVSQDYYRATGQSAAAGAMQGVRDGIPGIQEPLRQTLHGALVDDPLLKTAARDMTRSAVEVLEARLGSPEMRRQVDALVAQAMESLKREGDETVRGLIKAAGGTLEAELRRVATASILAATTTLRDSLERDVTPAAQRLASRMGEELVVSVVRGLEGPLQKTMLQAGRNMSQALIKGAAEGADDPLNQAGFGGLTNHVMLQAVRGARQGMTEGLPDQAQVALISGMVLLAALVLASSAGLGFFCWRYQQSAKTLTIVAKSINNHQSGALKDTIKKSTHDNYVGPWFSSFLKRRGL
jgi:hypothetical protein